MPAIKFIEKYNIMVHSKIFDSLLEYKRSRIEMMVFMHFSSANHQIDGDF